MFFRRVLLWTVIFTTTTTFCDISNQALWLPQESALRFHNNEPIKLKKDSLKKFIAKWQSKLEKIWKSICNQLNNEVELTPEKLEFFLQDESLGKVYTMLKEEELFKLKQYTKEEDIDPEVLTFIKRIIQKYCTKTNIKIILSPNINTITATFGTDANTHYVVCHSAVFCKENIEHFYNAMTNNNGAFYPEPISNSRVRFIELSNLLLTGLIEVASHIEHQSNLLTFLLSNFKFANKKLSVKTIKACWQFTEIRGILESILQSKNPLETALFIGSIKKGSDKEKSLWKNIIQNLSDCYQPESLSTFKATVKEINEQYNS